MVINLSHKQKKKIREGICQKYAMVSNSPEGLFKFPTGLAGLEALSYAPEMINALPDRTTASFCGVGNPFKVGPIHDGESVLDIGCGGGVDTLIASIIVGPTGRAVGIDVVPEMLQGAKESLRDMHFQGATFQEASAEDLPFSNESFDVVISNGAFNLVPDKEAALREVFRVLRLPGRLMMADQILIGELSDDTNAQVKGWAQ